MSLYFEYNKSIVEYIRKNGGGQLQMIHLKSVKWLFDNLQNGKDFMFSGAHAGGRAGKSILIVQELVWFACEEDLLAFRLATGL